MIPLVQALAWDACQFSYSAFQHARHLLMLWTLRGSHGYRKLAELTGNYHVHVTGKQFSPTIRVLAPQARKKVTNLLSRKRASTVI